jgi:hypothetical protein
MHLELWDSLNCQKLVSHLVGNRRTGSLRVSRLGNFAALILTTILAFDFNSIAAPTVGAHTLAFFPCNGSGGLATSPVATQISGSTILAWVGRGDTNGFTGTVPLDTKNNNFRLLGSVHDYSPLYPGSGEALYAVLSAVGNSG